MKICNKDSKFEKYIEMIQDRLFRTTMTKFRISDHELNIEKIRHKAVRREERHCRTSKTKAVESEEPLLLEFNLCSNYRSKLLNIINKYDLKFSGLLWNNCNSVFFLFQISL